MNPLWDPDRHEPLGAGAWDEAAAREGIRALCAQAEAAYDPGTLWPIHALDAIEGEVGPYTSLYVGGAGVAWSLDQLQRRGAITTVRDWRIEAKRFVEIYAAHPETGTAIPSLMLGEVGVRAVANIDERIEELVAANITNEAIELIWGAPGTMLAALCLFERTGEPRWRELYLRNAEHLIATLEYHADLDVWLWTQTLYGERVRQLGAAHGFAGNVFSLLRGAALLTVEQRTLVEQRAIHTLKSTALRDHELVNWSPHVGTPRKGREKILVQFCHGAPGMILGLARLPRNSDVDSLFAAGAETIWAAGPSRKGSGLCHGTAGNGYAFLAMFERTGDERWLDRARRFAIHALHQVRARCDAGRHSLWTGDPGVALYLHDCIAGTARLPTLEYL